MKAEQLPDGNLRITIDAAEQYALQVLKEDHGDAFHSDEVLCEFMEPFLASSDYNWIEPEVCNDMTAAPIIGVLGPQRKLREHEFPGLGNIYVGFDGQSVTVQDVVKRWGWMSYAVRSLQQELLDKGEAILLCPS